MPVGAIAVSGAGQVPVLVAVRGVAVLGESCIAVEPGRVNLGEAQGRPERPGDLSSEAGIDWASVAFARGDVFDQEEAPGVCGRKFAATEPRFCAFIWCRPGSDAASG